MYPQKMDRGVKFKVYRYSQDNGLKEQEKYIMDKAQLENTLKDMQQQLDHAKKEMQFLQKRPSSHVTELQALAEKQFSRANKLTDELARLRTKKQHSSDHTLHDVNNHNHADVHTEWPLEENKPPSYEENTNLKDENLSLNRENQHVRAELVGRSPHRYGRITVSTLETKLAGSEKDVTRFTKALERSDKYIKELESELKSYRDGKGGTVNDRAGSSSIATYSATSFLPTTFTSISSGSSYSTAISVPLTLTTSSYSSSRPSTSYAAKPRDPLSEHYSYVSNVSGGDLSKSDTFVFPEQKKRLFDSTDDLDMSVIPNQI